MTWSSDWIGGSGSPAEPASVAAWSLEELTRVQRSYTAERARADGERQATEPRDAERHQAELEEAWQRGYEEGLRQARAEMGAQLQSALATLEEVVARVRSGERTWLETLQDNLCALATAIARHVIGRELKGDAHAVAELVRRALSLFPMQEALRVRLHPADLSTLTLASTEDGASIPVAPGREIQWVADSEIQPGGCLVEGRHRVVDGRVDHALERIYQKLADA